MNFDIQKFISYNIDPTGASYILPDMGCIKCAMVESLGYTASQVNRDNDPGVVTYSDVGISRSGRDFFKEVGGIQFRSLMDKAEGLLLNRVPAEKVKKFVIDGMLAQGLIKTESLPNLSEELEHAK